LRDEQSVEQIEGPIRFRLGEKALQRVAGWPGAGGDLASELLALIDQRLEDPTVSEDGRTRLSDSGTPSATWASGSSPAC
jgi:hypothetical protein